MSFDPNLFQTGKYYAVARCGSKFEFRRVIKEMTKSIYCLEAREVSYPHTERLFTLEGVWLVTDETGFDLVALDLIEGSEQRSVKERLADLAPIVGGNVEAVMHAAIAEIDRLEGIIEGLQRDSEPEPEPATCEFDFNKFTTGKYIAVSRYGEEFEFDRVNHDAGCVYAFAARDRFGFERTFTENGRWLGCAANGRDLVLMRRK